MFGVAPRTSMYFASCTTPTITGESGWIAPSDVQRLPTAPPAGKNRRAIDWLTIVLRLPGRASSGVKPRPSTSASPTVSK